MWHLSAGGHALLIGKNYVPDQIMWLFIDSDRSVDLGRYASVLEAWEWGQQASKRSSERLFTYRATVRTLTARLDLQGFSLQDVKTGAAAYLKLKMDDPDRYVTPETLEAQSNYRSTQDIVEALIDWHKETDLYNHPADRNRSEPYLSDTWEDLCEGFNDPRFALALLLSAHRGQQRVSLDLTDLLFGGWLEPNEVPHATARRRLDGEVGSSGPVIVITEGRTDTLFLNHALRLAEPGLAPMFSFLDFEGTSSGGGVDKVVSLMRGMAAAGVMNRVIAVLDNDTAGRSGRRALLKGGLPENMTVTCLPGVRYAVRYPADGPEGRSLAIVNGRAAAIEMMFGLKVLQAASGGGLPPVRWTGYVAEAKDYQGSVANKGAI